MKKHILALCTILLATGAALAQPANDDCTNPIVLTNVFNFCSPNGAYSNTGATPSLYGAPSCWASTQNDVWFAFTAQATDVTVTIRGATSQAAGGTLVNPQLSLYFGTCGGVLNQLECQSAPPGSNIVEGYQGGLFVGSTYLIRVQGAAGATGTFQLCINNYNPPVDPQSDCPEAAILCDKSSFVVQNVTGAGSNTSEINDALCFSNGIPGNYESNSTWFVWTCSQSGTLEFTLTPNNISDDLDFVLYRLPNGIGNCAGKEVVRCMASGESFYPSPCMGPTGLRSGDNDVNEDAGCNDAGDDAWLRPFDMVAGETYALIVNNFTSTGNGFAIEFGGTGEFLGPTAEFTTIPAAVCLGTPVQVVDASTFPIGSITAWNWSFGADAVPQTATGPGPHTVSFNTSGTRPVVLTLETDLGCKVTDIQTVQIFPDVEVDTVIATPDCNGGTNGVITITNISMGTPPYQYSWENGPFTPDNSLTGLGVGVYNLVIRDANNCETELDIPVNEKTLTVDPDIEAPLCFGDDNGVVTLNVTNGTAPFQFDWGSGFVPDNTMGGFAAGTYTVQGLDAELCKGVYIFTVVDNPPVELEIDTTHISCFGADDGMGEAIATGGVGNFTYQWSDQQTTAIAAGLEPGNYAVTVADANGCSLTGSLSIIEPGELDIDLIDVVNLICNGLPTGEIRVEGTGGVPAYMFSPDGENYFNSDTLTGLLAGDYWVTIRDANGCTDSVAATITQPPPLIVDAWPEDTTLNLGYTIDFSTTTLPLGWPIVTYEWTPGLGLNCTDCPEPTLVATDDQLYVIKVTDQDGCMAFDTVRILVNKSRPIYIPNVFKPDGSYENSRFSLFGGPAMVSIPLLRIYDRWGSLIFEGVDMDPGHVNLNDGWDGTYKDKAVDGVFAFYAKVKFVDEAVLEYKGDVTVLR